MKAILIFLMTTQGVQVDLEAGFQGSAFNEGWARMTAVVRAEDRSLEGTLRLTVTGTWIQTARHERPLSLVQGSRKRIHWDLYIRGWEERITLEVLDAEGDLVGRKVTPLWITRPLRRNALVVGEIPVDLARRQEKWEVACLPVTAEALPDDLAPLLPVDTIIFLEPAPLSLRQETALRGYLRSGGRLVVFGGRDPGILRQGFWREVCPVDVRGTSEVTLETRRGEVVVPVMDGPRLRGEAFGQAIRAPHGPGEVIFLRFPWHPARAGEVSLPVPFWEFILGQREEDPTEVALRSLRITTVQDALPQLSASLPTRHVFPWQSAGAGLIALAVYAIAIGPFAHRRYRGRGRLKRGWIFFTACTTLGCALFLALGAAVAPPDSELDHVVFIDEGGIQGFTFLRGGKGKEYAFQGQGALSSIQARTSWRPLDTVPAWSVIPGSTLRLPVALGDEGQVVSFRAAPGEGWGLTCEWQDREGKVIRLVNETGLDLVRCILVRAGQVYTLGPILDGTTRLVDLDDRTVLRPEEGLARPDRSRWPVPVPTWGPEVLLEDRLISHCFYRRIWPDRPILAQRKIDLSDILDRGDGVFVGLFRTDTGEVALDAPMPVHTIGVIRSVLEW